MSSFTYKKLADPDRIPSIINTSNNPVNVSIFRLRQKEDDLEENLIIANKEMQMLKGD